MHQKIVALIKECCDIDSVFEVGGKPLFPIPKDLVCSCNGVTHITCYLKKRIIENDYSGNDFSDYQWNADSLVCLINEANDRIEENNGYIVFRLV